MNTNSNTIEANSEPLLVYKQSRASRVIASLFTLSVLAVIVGVQVLSSDKTLLLILLVVLVVMLFTGFTTRMISDAVTIAFDGEVFTESRNGAVLRSIPLFEIARVRFLGGSLRKTFQITFSQNEVITYSLLSNTTYAQRGKVFDLYKEVRDALKRNAPHR